MADFKDERAYDSKKLTQVFLWSSLALLGCVAWMAEKDYNRDWKDCQRRFNNLQLSKLSEQKADVISNIDIAQYKQLKADLKEAKADLKTQQVKIGDLESKTANLEAQIFKFNSDYQMVKANIDANKYTYSESNKEGKNVTKASKELEAEMAQAAGLNQKVFELKQMKADAAKQLRDIYAKRDDIQGRIDKMLAAYTSVKTKIQNLRPTLSFSNLGPYILFNIRNAMLLDFMSPTIQIQQVVLKNLPEDLYFSKTMRVDRCMTCHLAIDKKGFEDAPQPFRTHPHLDLYVGSNSSHSMDKVGCTVCHGGMGAAVDFNGCAHVPNSEEQAKKWEHKYSWTMPEGVQSTMLPLKYAESSCLKCHGGQEHINFAPKLDRGRELMITRGCVGCHKVKNLEGLTKAGPDLVRVKGKLKKEFVEKWVWSPKSFNPAARMPSFFQQTNNSDEESLAKTKAELHAIVEYLYEHSGNYTPNEAPGAGSVANGKKLFKEVGCMACHGIEDVTSHHADFAPDLSGTGSKLSAAFVYTWIKNPRHFNPETRMPSLRLSNQEASDITAYLMSKKNKDFEKADVPKADAAVRDSLIEDYLKPVYGLRNASTELAKMDDKTREQFLGQKSLGKYGCFGCHSIQGFETMQGIGTELSDWGTKRVSQLDFGLGELEHSHESFINAKLQDPRQFDDKKMVSFQDRLKMPNFYLNDEDREAVATAVLGLTKTYIPDDMIAGLHGNGQLLEKGRRVVANYNCRGCHLVEQQANKNSIREMYEKENIDLSMAPPNLYKEGSKVQIDWFRNFLTNVHPVRPWLHIRMPSFHWTDEELSNIITYFNLKDDQVYPFKTVSANKLTGKDLSEAKGLFNQLKCEKCHIVGAKIPADLSSAAPDLLKVRERLKPEWIVEWLKNPEAMSDKNTRMPGFWPQPEDTSSNKQYFHGNSVRQREALRDYLFTIGRAN